MAELEIHHINVGQGDSTLIINRDVTQLGLNIDAAILKDSSLSKPAKIEDYLPYAIKVNNASSTGPVIKLDKTVRFALLIDAGESVYGIDVNSYLISSGVTVMTNKKQFYTLATHFHSDHVNGFREIFFTDYAIKKKMKDQKRNFCPAIAYDCGTFDGWDDNPSFKNYDEAVKYLAGKNLTQRKVLKLLETISLGNDTSGVAITLKCIANNGTASVNGKTTSKQLIQKKGTPDQNARSTVLILQYGDFKYFLGGDIGGTGDTDGGNWAQNKDTRDKAFYSNHPDIETSVTAVMPKICKTDPKRANTSAGHTCCFFANHHGSGSSNDVFLIEVLKPVLSVYSSGVRLSFHCHPTQQAFNRMDITVKYSPKWQTPGKKDAQANTVTNTIQGYYINEMAKDGSYGTKKTPKDYTRTYPNGKILGDIIVRPIGNVTTPDATNSITIQVYGTGLMTDDSVITKPLRDAYSTAGTDPYPLGPFTHKCNLH